DRLGILVSRLFELMQIVSEHGASMENLEYLLKSIEMDHQLIMEHDNQSDSKLRVLAYSFSVGLVTAIRLMEEKKEKESNVAATDDDDSLIAATRYGENLDAVAARAAA
ncbi:hypothetical protein PFISCL1PPCAC_11720, partial [Pristionchus fissidentatus]